MKVFETVRVIRVTRAECAAAAAIRIHVVRSLKYQCTTQTRLSTIIMKTMLTY